MLKRSLFIALIILIAQLPLAVLIAVHHGSPAIKPIPKIAMAPSIVMEQGATSSPSVPVSHIVVNGKNKGPVFDGVGAISGGGGETRYLSDYPASERNQIFKVLFSPRYGASLQILKVEIGGDSNTTDGAEPSIEHVKGVVNCNAGYEWQFMEEARALNPSIKLYALSWGAPGWIGKFYSQAMINYLLTWLGCAKQHGLAINYLGGWNEHGFSPADSSWFEALRASLNAHGYSHVQIVAADDTPTWPNGTYDPYAPWEVASYMLLDPKLAAAISVIGVHDVCQYPTTGIECYGVKGVSKLNKPMWASELGHMDANTGGADMVRAINRGFIDIGLTGFITWPIMIAMPPGLNHENFGLITADQPWSGNYSVNQMTWAIAQTTQFTAVGWHYVNGADGYFGNNRANGSYVTYESNLTDNWSMVAEATTAKSARQLDVTIDPGLSRGVVEVFATNLKSSKSSQWFMHIANLKLVNGAFHYLLQPGYVYTFSTTSGQTKGGATVKAPAAKNFPLPYADPLTQPDSSDEAKYLATMDGAFQFAPCKGGMSGMCLEQVTPEAPIYWFPHPAYPSAIIGDNSLRNYRVSVALLFTSKSGSGGVIGRFSDQSVAMSYFNGYMLNLTEAGHWEILQVNTTGVINVLRSGQVSALGVNKWHSIALSLSGQILFAYIDGVLVGAGESSAYAYGPAGIEAGAFTGTWPTDQYRNLIITPSP